MTTPITPAVADPLAAPPQFDALQTLRDQDGAAAASAWADVWQHRSLVPLRALPLQVAQAHQRHAEAAAAISGDGDLTETARASRSFANDERRREAFAAMRATAADALVSLLAAWPGALVLAADGDVVARFSLYEYALTVAPAPVALAGARALLAGDMQRAMLWTLAPTLRERAASERWSPEERDAVDVLCSLAAPAAERRHRIAELAASVLHSEAAGLLTFASTRAAGALLVDLIAPFAGALSANTVGEFRAVIEGKSAAVLRKRAQDDIAARRLAEEEAKTQ